MSRTTATYSGTASSTSRRRSPSPATCSGRGSSPAGACARWPRARALQPDRLPRRHRLALRYLVHRLGPSPLRLQAGGRRSRRRHPRRRRGVRRAPARGLRWLRTRRDEVPGAVPDRLQPAGVVDGRATRSCARCSASSPSAIISSSTLAGERRPARAARHPPDAGAGSTPLRADAQLEEPALARTRTAWFSLTDSGYARSILAGRRRAATRPRRPIPMRTISATA